MNLRATDEILNATEHLPDGATLVVPQVSWEDYERLLVELAEHPHLRVSYDCGRLEIVSPLPEHEVYARFIDQVVVVFSDVLGLEVEHLGSTTWKKHALAKGIEPDCCYYIPNAKRVIGKREIDIEFDPPPDIVVEIDVTNSSLGELPVYAALAVPEVWRYDGRKAEIYELKGSEYLKIPGSRFLTGLTGSLLDEFIELSKVQGHTEARHALQQRIQSQAI